MQRVLISVAAIICGSCGYKKNLMSKTYVDYKSIEYKNPNISLFDAMSIHEFLRTVIFWQNMSIYTMINDESF